MSNFAAFVQSVWLTPGVSEFASALLGGAFAIGAQQLAIQQDRKRDSTAKIEENKARAWAIYFKISNAFEALNWALGDIEKAQAKADAKNSELWNFLQFPPHDLAQVQWEIEELIFLIDFKKLYFLERYRAVLLWMSNLTQSCALYREMRVEFLRAHPATVEGDGGVMEFTQSELKAVMPTIVHLRSLSNSIATTVSSQQPDAKKLLTDYAEAMKGLIGHRPKLEFVSTEKQTPNHDQV